MPINSFPLKKSVFKTYYSDIEKLNSKKNLLLLYFYRVLFDDFQNNFDEDAFT